MSNTPTPSPKHTPAQIQAYLTEQHAHYVDDPLYMWMTPNFEDMADMVYAADKCERDAREEREYLAEQKERAAHPDRLELQYFPGLSAQLAELTIYGRAA